MNFSVGPNISEEGYRMEQLKHYRKNRNNPMDSIIQTNVKITMTPNKIIHRIFILYAMYVLTYILCHIIFKSFFCFEQ